MPVTKLAHYSIRTVDLDASKRFYIDVLGFREGFRPPFDFPGAWLYHGEDESDYGVVHIIGVDSATPEGLADYLGAREAQPLSGSAAVDHLAFLATDLPAMHRRLNQASLTYRERTVPSLGLHQMFIEDPSGVTIELNFPAAEGLALAAKKSQQEIQ